MPGFDLTDPYAALPQGAVVGSASVRRQAQLKHARPDLKFVLFRGNVGTRLAKIGRRRSRSNSTGLCGAAGGWG